MRGNSSSTWNYYAWWLERNCKKEFITSCLGCMIMKMCVKTIFNISFSVLYALAWDLGFVKLNQALQSTSLPHHGSYTRDSYTTFQA